ncbi:hypothetical protein PBCVNEJV1_422R [Paramecium bursaria Chlorella virus NE-JV-1]|nr:hypothetical protein PBCVNEJV1_422R [Paramecium bursaria Chlorella virus NE-JV-1]
MLDTLIITLIIVMIGIVAYSESKYLLAKPTCTTCGSKNVKIDTMDVKMPRLNKVVESIKKQTKEIKNMLNKTKDVPAPVDFVDPIEHIAGSTNVVVGANTMENTIDEDLPFSEYERLPVKAKATDGTIQGVKPPIYSDPRVMNPALAAAPVQFSEPTIFGTFGVTDAISPAFSSKIPETNAKIAGDASFEGFEDALDANGARLVMNGKVVKNACELPSYQLRGITPHTSLPQRSLFEPPATVEDLVDGAMFEGLQGYPVDEKLDLLTPPGTATPMSEFAAINYGMYDG